MANYATKLLGLKRGQYMLYTSLLFFVLIIFWVGGSLLTSQTKSEISVELRKLALPLNPNIDTQVLSIIQNKRVYNQSSLSNFPIYMVIRSDDGKSQQVVPIEIGRATTNTSVSIPVPIITSGSGDGTSNSTQSAQTQINETASTTNSTPVSTQSAVTVVQ